GRGRVRAGPVHDPGAREFRFGIGCGALAGGAGGFRVVRRVARVVLVSRLPRAPPPDVPYAECLSVWRFSQPPRQGKRLSSRLVGPAPAGLYEALLSNPGESAARRSGRKHFHRTPGVQGVFTRTRT